MRRITKKLLIIVFGVVFMIFFCEFFIYYIVIKQCHWPSLKNTLETKTDNLKALLLTDPHLLGPKHSIWLDKWRREWQMHQAFQTIIKLHKPDVVFVLGDLFDEGEYLNDKQFGSYVKQFENLFYVPEDIQFYVVAGNHDIGFHNYIRKGSTERFAKQLNSPSVQLITLKENNFVLINSIAMEGDSCNFCTEARNSIANISDTLDKINVSRPILLQHFPFYRLSDAVCSEPDAAPLSEKDIPFRNKIDALSKEATDMLVSKIKPRAVFGGHTHYGCLLHHSYEVADFFEYSIPSFSWRNRPVPKYMLVTMNPNEYAVNKCALPREETIGFIAVITIIIIVYFTWKPKLNIKRKPQALLIS